MYVYYLSIVCVVRWCVYCRYAIEFWDCQKIGVFFGAGACAFCLCVYLNKKYTYCQLCVGVGKFPEYGYTTWDFSKVCCNEEKSKKKALLCILYACVIVCDIVCVVNCVIFPTGFFKKKTK